MDDILDIAKALFFVVYIFVRYPLALFVVVNAGIRLAFGWCGSRKTMAAALIMALPITIWNVAISTKKSLGTDMLALILSALAVAGLVFWAMAMRHTPQKAKHPAVEVLAIIAAIGFWLGVIVLLFMKTGFIAH